MGSSTNRDTLAVLPVSASAAPTAGAEALSLAVQASPSPLAPSQARDVEFTVRQVLKTLAVRDLEALETGRPVVVRLDGIGLPSAVLEVRLEDQQLLMTVNTDDEGLVRWVNASQDQLNVALRDSAPGALTVEVKALRTDALSVPESAPHTEVDRLVPSASAVPQATAAASSWSASWLQSQEVSKAEGSAAGGQGEGRGGAFQGDPSQGQRDGRESARQDGWAAVDRDARRLGPAAGDDRSVFQQALWSSVGAETPGAGGR